MKVDVKDVKTLRVRTQASYAYCKEALLNSNNIGDAVKYLTEKGLKNLDAAPVDKNEHGIIKAYVHPGDRVCAVVEVGCDTDFVAKTEEFQLFAKEIAMQVASMKPLFVDRSDISFEREVKEMSFRRERLQREGYEGDELEKALSAEMGQWFAEVCLLEQSYVRNSNKSVKDLLAELVSKLQENCKIRRFSRWEIGSESEEEDVCEEIEPITLVEKIRFPATLILIAIVFCILFGVFV